MAEPDTDKPNTAVYIHVTLQKENTDIADGHGVASDLVEAIGQYAEDGWQLSNVSTSGSPY